MTNRTLRTELLTDPLNRGYAGMTDTQAAASLNTVNRTRERSLVPAYEVIEATVPSEWTPLTAAEKQRYQTITGAGDVNLSGANTRASLAAMFGAGTQTRTNLIALQTESCSRAGELGLGEVTPGEVGRARA